MSRLRILCILPEGELPLAALADQLRAAGHEVVVAAPAEAEALLGAGATPFDAVLRPPAADSAAPAPLEAAEKRHIAAILTHTRGNKRQAAHLLGIARSTLLAKVRKYEL